MSLVPKTGGTDASGAALKKDQSPGLVAAAEPLVFRTMQASDLVEVEAIERAVYEHPWSLTNFQDSLASGYACWVVHDADGQLSGYFLLMAAPDVMHLLDIAVRPALHGRGLGRRLLEQIFLIVRASATPAVLLEVRPSNLHALAVYHHVGFRQIGVRKAYYPATGGQREDAIVMQLVL